LYGNEVRSECNVVSAGLGNIFFIWSCVATSGTRETGPAHDGLATSSNSGYSQESSLVFKHSTLINCLFFSTWEHTFGIPEMMEASELARWTRFAAKGGIGKCTALQDCVAEAIEDLMFLKVNIFCRLLHFL
jgi:hypothetical protein